ncbi:tyrosine kinase receptor Cad96Ca isoform X2 [Musca domestica]|nr:tyrosine kinase receptor Cad96Ca isoform X2 [Musca domestica]XP_058982602.1 tyrosine kinase receptor Cad96Ca isoform X2 [Musca domestica]
MNTQHNKNRRVQNQICRFLIITLIFFGLSDTIFKKVLSQEHFHLNTPPILLVPDRNWRIPENETVGQIIARIRADDSENNDLTFGLEAQYEGIRLPFRIDPVGGIVYLNESLVGRGGENFFLYITVTDGELTAKNEVYVNVLSTNDSKNKYVRNLTSLTNVIHNVSLFLPSFDRLPGVQSIRNQESNLKSVKLSPTNSSDNESPRQLDIKTKENNNNEHFNDLAHSKKINQKNSSITTENVLLNDNLEMKPLNKSIKYSTENKDIYEYNTQIVLVVVTISSIFLFSIVVLSIVFRKRLCSFGKTLKAKSKEEMIRACNQNNFDSMHLNDGSRNSMVLNQWHGPMAYSNRYVPWETDLQRNQQHHQEQPTNEISHTTSNVGSIGNHDTILVNSTTVSNSAVETITIHQSGNKQCEFPRHRLKFFHILGEGAFGQVWRCEATDIGGVCGISTVAVKTLKENATEAEKKDLLSELEVMKSLEPHVNVVGFLGCCTDKDPIFVIMEYVNKGKLQTYLRSSRAERHYGNTHGKSNILTSGDLTSFIYQIANGMQFLTSRGIIHRDLAARNILITDNHICKVADFGFARDVITSKVYERKSEGKLPIRWMAIESLFDNIFSSKSDIWSFGILMWEIVTLGSTPYPGYAAAEVMRKVRDGYRLEKPEHCRRELYNIMYYCWSKDPNDRPTFEELVQMLDRLLQAEMEYIELERFPDHNYYNIPSVSNEKV